jgi:hypothetical protein
MGSSSPPFSPLLGDNVLKIIGDSIGKYIDKSELKPPMFPSARICIEVELEKIMPKYFKTTLTRIK